MFIRFIRLRLTLTALASSLVWLAPLPPYTPTQTAVAQAQSDLAEADRLNEQIQEQYQQGRYAEALPLAKQVLAIHEQAFGADHPKVAYSLNILALLYKSQGEYAKAEPLYQRSLAILEKSLGAEHQNVSVSLSNLAGLYLAQGEYAKAEPLYQRSLAIAETAFGSEHPDIALSLTNLAELYAAQVEYAKAEPLYLRSLTILEQALGADHPNVALGLNNLAWLYESQGEYAKAEPLYLRSLAIWEKTLGADHPDVGTGLNNLAGLYHAKGEYAKAEPLYLRSLAIWEKALGVNNPDVALSINNLANIYALQGQYVKAEPLYLRSLAIREKALGADHPDVAQNLNSLAWLYNTLGQFDKAEALYLRSLAIWEKALGADHPDVALGLNNVAEVYRARQEYAKAEPLYQRSLDIREKKLGLNHPDVAISLENLAGLYDNQGEYAKAEPLYQRSLDIREKKLGSNHPDVANSLNNLAGLYFSLGQYDKAEAFYQRSLAIRDNTFGSEHPDVAISLNNLSTLYWVKNDLPKTVAFLRRSLDVEEINLAQNLLLGTEQDKRAYLNTVMRRTDGAISWHLQAAPNNLESAKLALTTILRRKGRILDVLGQTTQQLQQSLDSATQAEFDQLVAVRAQLAKLAFQRNVTPEQRQAQHQTLTQQSQTLEASLSRKSIAFQQATQSVTIAAVQAAIPQDAVLVEFIQYSPFYPSAKQGQRWGDPRYAVYLLQPDGKIQWADLGTVEELQPLIEAFNLHLKDRQKRPKQIKAAARQLDSKLMQPVRDLLKKQPKHLLIAPDAELNLIPFAALVDEQDRYLVERYQITYLTSGRDLIRLKDQSVQAQSPLIVANPDYRARTTQIVASSRSSSERSSDLSRLSFNALPGTAEEAETISPLIPNTRLFTEETATETIIKEAPNPRILHLATHGFFLKNNLPAQSSDPNQPQPFNIENPLLRSGLAFTGFNRRSSGNDDGVLTALEVAGLDLRATQLVVLSACETGLGEVANGEGVYGLRRAFTLAGAHSQLMTLWKVDDQGTKDVMIHYYQALMNSEGRGDAIRQVQLDMIHQQLTGTSTIPGNADPNYQHPYYWAAFIPLGDWTPLPSE